MSQSTNHYSFISGKNFRERLHWAARSNVIYQVFFIVCAWLTRLGGTKDVLANLGERNFTSSKIQRIGVSFASYPPWYNVCFTYELHCTTCTKNRLGKKKKEYERMKGRYIRSREEGMVHNILYRKKIVKIIFFIKSKLQNVKQSKF